MMPWVMRYNIEGGKAVDKYARIAVAFGVHDALKSNAQNARRAVDAIVRLSIDVGTAIPTARKVSHFDNYIFWIFNTKKMLCK